MTTHYPRRVKDLLQFEPDSEDDFNTPRKPAQNKEAPVTAADKRQAENKASNKENAHRNEHQQAHAACSRSKVLHGDLPMFPKRSSELVMLDSDTEEDDDDEESKGNLNCAILNDSFILSPDQNTNTCTTSSTNIKQQTSFDTNLSFLGKFGNMAINCDDKRSYIASPEPVRGISSTKPPAALQTIDEHKVCKATSVVVETPIQKNPPPAALTANTKSTNKSTLSQSHADAQFATPQIHAYSVRRCQSDLCSTQSQRTRANMVKEFSSQKVLFQTPMTVTRAIATMSNDSISLSLCDTINEDTPKTPADNTPQTQQQQQEPAMRQLPNTKTKKSLEPVFRDVEHENDKTEKPTPSSSSSSAANVLHIKNADYEIVKKLGCGGSSSVYLARRQDNGQEFALKVVDLHGDPAIVEGYLNETKLLAKLQGNICVVSLFEYQLLQKESKLYLVMEKGDSDLNKILQTYTTNLPLYVLANFLYQMLQAVNYIHQNGVIHSDLKPANFLMVNGRLKLIDFGIASNIGIDSTSIIKFSQAGTFNYISPEALTDTSTGSSPMRSNQPKIKISTKSDVWSLGCILYLLLYQKTPFNHIKNIYQKISAISSPTTTIDYPALPIFYPMMLVNIVKSCLQHNPKKRPSCAELLKYPFHMIIPIQNLSVPGPK